MIVRRPGMGDIWPTTPPAPGAFGFVAIVLGVLMLGSIVRRY